MFNLIVRTGSKKYLLRIRNSESIGEVLGKEGLLALPCGGKGLCGLCRITVLRGEVSELSGNERIIGVKPPERLACRVKPLGDVEVEIPPIIMPKAVSQSSLNISVKQWDPLNLRLRDLYARSVVIDHGILAELISKYSANHGSDKVLLIDLGTTKIAYQVMDIKWNILEEDIIPTPLHEYGSDIISRLTKIIENPYIKIEMRRRLMEVLENLSGISNSKLALICGNTFMEYLFLDLPLESLSRHPFKPPLKGPFLTHVRDIMVIAPPILNGFVGGDAYADLVATIEIGLKPPYLIIDIGTNTEVLLVTDTYILVTSAPAGPAIEGKVGRASYIGRGGVTKVRIINTINEKPVFSLNYIENPRYFLGSGLLSLIAELKRHGFIRRDGVFLKGYEVFNGVKTFVVDTENDLYFTQVDMRRLQEALAAIKVAWKILLEEAGINKDLLENVVVTGNMAIHVEIDDLVETGLIPFVDKSRILLAGNLVLSGLRVMFLDNKYILRYEDVIGRVKHVYLPMVPNYMKKWVENLALP
ncbi:MAG: ASKHA domain-containing protein [Desulfurococcaceae archaeon]